MDKDQLKRVQEREYFAINDNFSKNKEVKSTLICGNHKEIPPFITIIIPAYKRAHLMKAAIDSVLEQKDFDDYQILIVDDDTEFKESEEMIQTYNSEKIIYYRNEKCLGIFGNWNRCIELARTKWLCMLHDDDLLVENHLAVMTSIIKNNKEISFLSCRHQYMDERKSSNLNIDEFKMAKEPMSHTIHCNRYENFNHNFVSLLLGAVWDREKAMAIGGFDTEFSLCEDYFFTAKFAYYYCGVYTNLMRLYVYRWGENESLKTGVWEDMVIHEYYLYRYISNKRPILVRELFKNYSKYRLVNLVRAHNDGTSFLEMKCNINEKYVMEACNIKEYENKNSIYFMTRVCVMFYNKVNSLYVRRLNIKI